MRQPQHRSEHPPVEDMPRLPAEECADCETDPANGLTYLGFASRSKFTGRTNSARWWFLDLMWNRNECLQLH